MTPDFCAVDHAPWITLGLLVLGLAVAGDDDDLARRIRAGDRAAFKEFFDENHDVIYRYLRGRGLPPDAAADAVQQAFIVLWEKRGELRSGTSLRAFVFRIGYRRALNDLRSQKHAGWEESAAAIAENQTAPSTDDALVMRHFEDALDNLPERRRLVFELCFVHGYTYREAAAVLEVSVKTVENQMGHALKAMRAALAVYDETSRAK